MLLLLHDLTHKGGTPICLSPGTYQIGRRTENDIVLSNDSSVSRQHAKIRVTEHDCWIFDFSSYGTEVNGNRVQYAHPQRLKNGDLVRFGTRDYLFQCKLKGAKCKNGKLRKQSSFRKSTLSSLNKSKSSAEYHFDPLITSSTNALNDSGDAGRWKGSSIVRSQRHSLDSPCSMEDTLDWRSHSPKPNNTTKARAFLETFGSTIPQSPNVRLGEGYTKGHSSLKVSKNHILQIINSDISDEGNQFFTVEYLDGSVGSVLREVLLLQGYGYLIEEFEGKRQTQRYEDYYNQAVLSFKKRIGYFKHKYAGFWVAVDNSGEVILFNADKDTLINQLKQLRQIDASFRKRYLAPFIVALPSIHV